MVNELLYVEHYHYFILLYATVLILRDFQVYALKGITLVGKIPEAKIHFAPLLLCDIVPLANLFHFLNSSHDYQQMAALADLGSSHRSSDHQF